MSPAERPLVYVVGEEVLHAVLVADPDLAVWDERFSDYHSFWAAASSKAVPTDHPLTVVVVSDALRVGHVSVEEFVSVFGALSVLVCWEDDHPALAPSARVGVPVTHNGLRAGVAACAGIVLAPRPGGDVALGDSPPTAAIPPGTWRTPASAAPEAAPPADEAVSAAAPSWDPPASTGQFGFGGGPNAAPERSASAGVGGAGEHSGPTHAPDNALPPWADGRFDGGGEATGARGDARGGASSPPQASPTPLTSLLDEGAATDGSGSDAAPPSPPFGDRTVAARRLGFANVGGRDPELCQVFAVYSSKGGVGKTTMAVNLAARLAHVTDLEVAVVDLDLGDPNVAKRMGRFDPTVAEFLMRRRVEVGDLELLPAQRHTGFRGVLGPTRRPTDEQRQGMFHPGSYRKLLRVMRQRFDVVFLDCPVELHDPLVSEFALAQAARIVFVVDNDAAALVGYRSTLEEMVAATDAQPPGMGIAPERIGLLLNQMAEDIVIDKRDIRAFLPSYDMIATFPDNSQLWGRQANEGVPMAVLPLPEVHEALDGALRWLLPDAALPSAPVASVTPMPGASAPATVERRGARGLLRRLREGLGG